MANPIEIERRNADLRQSQGSDADGFPPEQESLYSYDAEAVLHA
jgi:hypothetical protein